MANQINIGHTRHRTTKTLGTQDTGPQKPWAHKTQDHKNIGHTRHRTIKTLGTQDTGPQKHNIIRLI